MFNCGKNAKRQEQTNTGRKLGLKGMGSRRFKPTRHNAETTLKPILTFITKVSFESRQAKITTDLQYVNCRVFNKDQQPAKLAGYST